MARRRREVSGDAPTTTDEAPAVEGPGPQATLTVRGTAEAVRSQLVGSGSADDRPQPEKKVVNGHDDEKAKFAEALRNPRFLVRIKRQSPRSLAGPCWDAECPIAYTKLQDETKEGWGGGTFRAVIVDPESNKTITADHFEIPGEPIAPETDMTAEEQQKLFMHGTPKTPAEMTVDGLNRRAEVTAKMLEVESLEAQLEDARKRREGGGKPVAQDTTRIDELDRKLAEAKHQAELEARDRKHAEEMRELKALIAQNSQPRREEGGENKMMMMLLEQMREDRKASDARFNAMMTSIQDQKMNVLMEEVKSIKNRPNPQSGSLLEQAEAMLKLKTLFGWGGDDADEDDDADDPNDDRPWWEKALDKLGGKLGEQLFAKFTNMEEKGEKVDRAKFLAETSQYADQIAAEAVAKAQAAAMPRPAALPALPAPAPVAARPAIPPPPAPVTSLPPPPPPAGSAPSPAPIEAPPAPPAPTQEMPVKFSLDQEIAIRVGGVLEMIDREMELRPGQYLWNYEGAYNALPESILEKVCAAADPASMIDAMAVQGINGDVLTKMKEKISGSPRISAWLKAGLDELKLWWEEKQKDPSYDPFADDEEGGEE